MLKGDNVFEGSSIETGSCKVTVSGDGNLSLVMTSSSDGVYVGVSSGGGELIFAGTGTFSVSGSGDTPMQLYGGQRHRQQRRRVARHHKRLRQSNLSLP